MPSPKQQPELTELLARIRDEQDPERRAELSEELNGLQPTSLPPEILSIIFVYAFRPPNKKLYWNFGLVSRRWRRVLLSTPELWTVINLDMSTARARGAFVAFIANSGDRALSVTLRFDGSPPSREGVLIDRSVDAKILEGFARIQTLHLTNPPVSWFQRLPQLQKVQRLTLKGHEGPRVPTNIPIDQIPSLTHVTLSDLKNVHMYSTCTNITSLTITKMRLPVSVRIFSRCVNLKKLHLEYLGRVQEGSFLQGVDSEDGNFPNRAFTLEHLEEFEWHLCKPEDVFVLSWQSSIWGHLNLPSLRSMKWVHTGEPPRAPSMNSFFNRASLTLQEVEFVRVAGSTGPVFEDGYGIEKVVFHDCPPKFIDDVLGNIQSPSRLPMLKSVEIKGAFLEQLGILKMVRRNYFVSMKERARLSGKMIMLNGVSVKP